MVTGWWSPGEDFPPSSPGSPPLLYVFFSLGYATFCLCGRTVSWVSSDAVKRQPVKPRSLPSSNASHPDPSAAAWYPPAPSTSSTSVSSHTSPQEISSKRWLDVIGGTGVGGSAVSALAKWLASRRKLALVDAAELSVDLLTGESDEFLEALITLLGDGWEHSLGELLACARRL